MGKKDKDKPVDNLEDFRNSDEFLDRVGEKEDMNDRVKDFLDGLKDSD